MRGVRMLALVGCSSLSAMAAAPILMERPIVVRGAQARVGRPPQAVRELFEE